MHAFDVCPFKIAGERTVEFGQINAPGTFGSLLKFGDTCRGEPLLPVPVFPADVDVLVGDPREFGGGISVCANVTVMSYSAGVMGCSFGAGGVDQVPRL